MSQFNESCDLLPTDPAFRRLHLVYEAFPKIEGGPKLSGTLTQCQPQITQIFGLIEQDGQYFNQSGNSWKYCELLFACQEYVFESFYPTYMDGLCLASLEAVSNLEDSAFKDKARVRQLIYQAKLEEVTGHTIEAIEGYDEAYQLLQCQDPPNYHLIAVVENNLGLCHNMIGEETQHLVAQQYFIALHTSCKNGNFADFDTIPGDYEVNRARCHAHLGYEDEAKLALETLINRILTLQRDDVVARRKPLAYAFFTLATIQRGSSDLSAAKLSYEQAHVTWLLCSEQQDIEDHQKNNPFRGACLFGIGMVEFQMDDMVEAMQHFEESIEVTKKCRELLPMMHARGLWMLHHMLLRGAGGDSRVFDGQKFREKAERLMDKRDPDIKNKLKEKDPLEQEPLFESYLLCTWR